MYTCETLLPSKKRIHEEKIRGKNSIHIDANFSFATDGVQQN
jgi:hypothetical protein